MTQDVHNMHIIGIAENEKGDKFYIIKNSSDAKDCGGYVYMSKEYLLLKTISVMVNKNAIPSEIRKKVEIKL
jgi:bleomycin hydrolase